jgi:hypothetical protein
LYNMGILKKWLSLHCVELVLIYKRFLNQWKLSFWGAFLFYIIENVFVDSEDSTIKLSMNYQ